MAYYGGKINKLAEMINHQINNWHGVGRIRQKDQHKDDLTTELERDKEVHNGEKR
jgi:hypothetical protein